MAFWMGQPFLQILLGPGLACGVMFGITMGLFFGITMRTSTFSIPVAGRPEFLSRLDGEMGKLRYRPEATVRGCSDLQAYGPHPPEGVLRRGAVR